MRTAHPTAPLDLIAWRLWWNGREVEFDAVRRRLARLATDLDAERSRLAELLQASEAGDEAAADELDSIRMAFQKREAPADHPLRAAEVRVGSAVTTVVQVLIEIGAGTFVGFPKPTGDLNIEHEFDRALGLDRARTDAPSGVAPWLAGRVESDLIALSGMIGRVRLADDVAQMSRRELEAHRRIAKPLLSAVTAIGALAAVFADREAYGLASLGTASGSDEGQQLYLLGSLVLAADPRLRGAMRMIAKSASAFPDPRDVLGHIHRLRRAAAERALRS